MTRNLFAPLCLPLVILFGSGCATNSPTGPVYDPYEGLNRSIYRFNTAVDDAVLQPVARGYRLVTPDFLELGVTNFFNNLDDVTDIANALLQGKFGQAANDGARVVVNTTAGIFGFFDAATKIGLAKNDETFGQTLGVWGVGEGPFIMLPLLGPSNGRDAVGRVPDSTAFSAQAYLFDGGVDLGLTATEVISVRARLLSAGNLLNQAALDPYLLLRDFWVKRHREATVDGREPVAIGLPANLRRDGDRDETR